jgi:myo-inositol-1(or 4)-monophosphatase
MKKNNPGINSEYREIAIKAAEQASRIIMDRFGSAQAFRIKQKKEIITETDGLSEQIICSTISTAFPDHDILAEESGLKRNHGKYRWIVDPLDGTTNFAHGFPFISVSIALEIEDKLHYGLVYDPLRDELFEAEYGHGAYLNGEEIKVSEVHELEQSLLGTGFPYDRRIAKEKSIPLLQEYMAYIQGVRRSGSAALDLCYVACGRYDGFFEFNLHAWDVAAGSLIIQEAGGTITDQCGKPHNIFSDFILASNGHFHDKLVQISKRFI